MTRWVVLWLAALALAACETPIKAQHDFDSSAPFPRYRTFAWVTEQSLLQPVAGVTAERQPSPMLDPAIRAAVERNLRAKGYEQLRDPGKSDLVLSYSVGARDKIQVSSYPVAAGYRYGPYRGWGGVYETEVRTYTEGVLALDFFDRRTKQAVWHGWATRRLPSKFDPAKRDEIVGAVVEAILAPFPPRASAPGSAPPPAEPETSTEPG
jgi:hypothetical protein